jgi:hypothetical protein
MLELLLLFSFGPWAFFLALLGLCCFSAYQETTFFAVVGLVIFTLISYFAYDAGPAVVLFEDPLKLLMYCLGYCAVGVLWSLFKWNKLLSRKDIKDDLQIAKRKYEDLPAVGVEFDSLDAFMASEHFPRSAKASHNKDRIVAWISLWPMSGFLFFFEDIVLKFFSNIYELFAGVFDRITKRHL